MRAFIVQAKRCLPDDSPAGTLIRVPVHKHTGNIPLIPIDNYNADHDIYKFLRTRGKWIYLGKGEIPENQKHLFKSVDFNLRNKLP